MDNKINNIVIFLCIGFLVSVAYYLWPTKNRMLELCSDEKYGNYSDLKILDLKTKIIKDTEYQNLFKECEIELNENPNTFKIKYRSKTMKDRGSKFDVFWKNFFN